jgi:uncharacterized membrane protein
MTSKTAAQQRADAIRVFRDELSRLESEGGLALTPEQRQRLEAHHAALIESFGRSFDIDRTTEEAQLSAGMRIASFLGAIALSASVFYLFQQFWGRLGTPVQVVRLVGAAVLSFVLTVFVSRRDPSGYFTGLAAIVAFACFVLDLAMLGKIFNVTPSPEAFLAWSALAFLLAYQFDLRVLLAAGIVCAGIYVAGRGASLVGVQWSQFIARPENVFVPAAMAFVAPRLISHADRAAFPAVYRGLGLTTAMLAILALAGGGELSYVRIDKDWIESTYQWIGFIVSAAVVWIAIRRGWTESLNLGVLFFVIFLFMKFVDWWWETMPRYLFFLVLGLTSVLIILVLGRLRTAAGDPLRGQPA